MNETAYSGLTNSKKPEGVLAKRGEIQKLKIAKVKISKDQVIGNPLNFRKHPHGVGTFADSQMCYLFCSDQGYLTATGLAVAILQVRVQDRLSGGISNGSF